MAADHAKVLGWAAIGVSGRHPGGVRLGVPWGIGPCAFS